MLPSSGFIKNKLLKELCTIGIGGPAEIYTTVRTFEQMQLALKYCYQNNIRTLILGKGSNILFDDKGFKGAVIQNKIDFLEEKENGLFYVGAGCSFSLLGAKTAKKGWAGLEFASGIPGTVGGAVFMNAGANGKETKDVLIGVDFMTDEGKLLHFEKKKLHFSYRNSIFQGLKGAIVAAYFQLSPSKEARDLQLKIISYRTKTQPYKKMSAGCMFRNPENGKAGALIDQLGLKGLAIGGAKVSDMHANFIVNEGKGTTQDVLQLIQLVKEKVFEKSGVALETEVKIISWDESL